MFLSFFLHFVPVSLLRCPGTVFIDIVAVGSHGVLKHLSVASHIVPDIHPLIRHDIAEFIEIIPVAVNFLSSGGGDFTGNKLIPASALILEPLAKDTEIGGGMFFDVGKTVLIDRENR